MPTIIETLKADKWTQLGKYASGKADQITTILEMFGEGLDPALKQWLYNTRTIAREEAGVSFQNALDIYKNKGDQE